MVQTACPHNLHLQYFTYTFSTQSKCVLKSWNLNFQVNSFKSHSISLHKMPLPTGTAIQQSWAQKKIFVEKVITSPVYSGYNPGYIFLPPSPPPSFLLLLLFHPYSCFYHCSSQGHSTSSLVSLTTLNVMNMMKLLHIFVKDLLLLVISHLVKDLLFHRNANIPLQNSLVN